MNTKQVDEMAVQTYNSAYTAYFGNAKSGAEVKALLDKINAHNNTEKDNSLKIYISTVGVSSSNVTYKCDSTSIANTKNDIQAGKTYTVKESTNASHPAYDATTGYIVHIGIKAN